MGISLNAGTKLTALAAGFLMATVDTTVVNVAGVKIKDALNLSLSTLTWVIDGYVLTYASTLLLAGSLADRCGAKRMYLSGLLVFITSSLACGVAPNGLVLVGARLLQGVGAALFMPSSLSLLVSSFPDPRRQIRMLGLWTAIVSTSLAIGPVVGGLLVGSLGWRSIFLINMPIGLIGFWLTYRVIEPIPGRPLRLSVLGNLLCMVSLSALCLFLIEGPGHGWTSPLVVMSAGGAITTGFALVVHQRLCTVTAFPTALFRIPNFAATSSVSFLINLGFLGSIYLLGLFLQISWHSSPTVAGIEMLPLFIGPAIGNVVYARIGARTGPHRILTIALSIAGAGSIGMVTLSESTPYWLMAVFVGVANLGVGVSLPAVTTALMATAGSARANIASSTFNASRQFGGLVGIALSALILQTFYDWYTAASVAFLSIGLAYFAAAMLSWRLTRGRYPSTRRGPTQ